MSKDKILVLDTETTGLDPEADCVIEVAARMGLGPEAAVMAWKIRPTVPISKIASETHGITDEMTVDWPLFGEVADDVAEVISWATAIVGYNPDFDIRMLRSEFRRAGRAVDWPRVVICSKRLWDLNEPPPPRHLQAAYARFVDPAGFAGAHGAIADTLATARLFEAQRAKFGLMDKPLADLDPYRKLWWCGTDHFIWSEDRSTIMVGFGKHSGKDARDLDGGYLRWLMGQDWVPQHVLELAKRLKQHVDKKTRPTAARVAEWAAKYEMETAR